MRQPIDADIHGLRKFLDDLTMTRSELVMQIEALNKELTYLKKNHQEEMTVASVNFSGEVSVEMDAPPGQDLTEILKRMRGDYEVLAEKNRREAQAQFLKVSEELKVQLSRLSLQKLELDLQTTLAKKRSLELTSAETEQHYGTELMQIQQRISGMEEQLLQLCRDMELQSFEYQRLLDIRTRLEMERETYRHVLEDEFEFGRLL
ncbi:hypothetical protein NDU88_002190 [Pleurodeles waltl]|uniref:IF rod domain-containing protein n=2 Tax=Pleurodeles waltl TaxID=8319 RepID=A0AAV7Q807_PLEWA|nr:hypothetical protein NDU88_002190 [Pleurodeles waltl]